MSNSFFVVECSGGSRKFLRGGPKAKKNPSSLPRPWSGGPGVLPPEKFSGFYIAVDEF